MSTGPKECPDCKLLNPPATQRCDCGYDFLKGAVEIISPRERSQRNGALGSRLSTLSVVISGVAYLSFLVLGSMQLAMLSALFSTPGRETWWGYFYIFGVYSFGIPLLGVISVVLGITRQFFGLEIKLLLLSIVTVIYLTLFAAGMKGLVQIDEPTMVVSAGVVTLWLCIWHYFIDRKR